MQKFNIAASEVKTTTDLIAYFRADGQHDIADNFLIGSGSLELHSGQDYHYSDEPPTFSEMAKELAFIRRHMIALKTNPERFTLEHSDAVLRALYCLASTALDEASTDRVN